MNSPSPITKAPETLLPCPFCGNGPVVKKLDHPYWDRAILCTVCYCKTGEYSSGNESHMVAMHDAWNRRTPASAYDSLARELELLKEQLKGKPGRWNVERGLREKAEADNECLREALQMLTDEVSAIIAFDADESLQSKVHRARAALKFKPSNEVGTL